MFGMIDVSRSFFFIIVRAQADLLPDVSQADLGFGFNMAETQARSTGWTLEGRRARWTEGGKVEAWWMLSSRSFPVHSEQRDRICASCEFDCEEKSGTA